MGVDAAGPAEMSSNSRLPVDEPHHLAAIFQPLGRAGCPAGSTPASGNRGVGILADEERIVGLAEKLACWPGVIEPSRITWG